MKEESQRMLNALKDAFLIELPLSRTHKNIDLDTSHELMTLYKSAKREAMKRIDLDKLPRRIAETQLPYGLQNFTQFVQLAYTAANLETKLGTKAGEVANKQYLTKEDLKEIIGYNRIKNDIYTKFAGSVEPKPD